MPVPWTQILQLAPTIVELSRELLARSRRPAPAPPPLPPPRPPVVLGDPVAFVQVAEQRVLALEQRIATLEDNERRQAELVEQIAEQLNQLSGAVLALHKLTRRLRVGMWLVAGVLLVLLAMAMAMAIFGDR